MKDQRYHSGGMVAERAKSAAGRKSEWITFHHQGRPSTEESINAIAPVTTGAVTQIDAAGSIAPNAETKQIEAKKATACTPKCTQ